VFTRPASGCARERWATITFGGSTAVIRGWISEGG
jgi:hypothetical protein